MKNKHIFITGGTGFFGKSLLLHCRDLKDNNLVILSRDPEKLLSEFPYLQQYKSVEFLAGDVRDFKFPAGDFDYIYHGATTSGSIIADDEMSSVVLGGTKRVIEFAKQNKNLERFLYISSGAVYGNKNNDPISEDFPCEPVNVYGKSKLEAEQLCIESGLPCSIARCFAFVGEYLPINAHFAIGNFIRDCLNNKDIVIKGDGTPLRSYLYSGDLAYWLWTILLNGKNGEAYNVGSDYPVSIAELAAVVKKVSGSQNEIQILTPPSGAKPQCYLPDISKASKELGLEVKTSLDDAISRTIAFYEGKE